MKKIPVINGTSLSVTLAARDSPPRAIKKIMMPRATAVQLLGIPDSIKTDAIELVCIIFPIPKEDKKQPKAYIQARGFPIFFIFSMYPKAPLAFLYLADSIFSANTVIMPKRADIHIQNTAPGPPIVIADATPTMFPVPIEPASAVVID